MKSIGEIMAEMGFNKEGSDSVKEAFIKHLLNIETPSHIAMINKFGTRPKSERKKEAPLFPDESSEPTQLSFNFENADEQKKRTG